MRIWAIVPVKRLAAAKSRLAPILSLRQRRALVCFLLEHTLKILKGDHGIAGILVVGRDRAVRAIARKHGAAFLCEEDRGGLNRALARAQAAAVRRKAEAVLVLPADLPLLSRKDIAWVKKSAGRPPLVALEPDRSERGTNLLLMAPPGIIRFSFGPGSFARHAQAARRAGIEATVLRRRTLEQDLDLPEDLARVFGAEEDPWNPRRKRRKLKVRDENPKPSKGKRKNS
jgi:2-phospho-L-lactate guanylyltransferase